MDFITNETKKDSKSKITFKQDSKTYVSIMRNGKQIGHIYSQLKDGGRPYPHRDDTYCNNSIQLCGFDRLDGPWACGPFQGHKDLVAHFRPTEDKYYNDKKTQYADYVKGYIGDEKKDPRELLSFEDWVQTIGAF